MPNFATLKNTGDEDFGIKAGDGDFMQRVLLFLFILKYVIELYSMKWKLAGVDL